MWCHWWWGIMYKCSFWTTCPVRMPLNRCLMIPIFDLAMLSALCPAIQWISSNFCFWTHSISTILLHLHSTLGPWPILIHSSTAKADNLPIHPASQIAQQADGATPLHVISEVQCNLSRGSLEFRFDAMVVKQLDLRVLAGNPFLVTDDIAVRPLKRQIIIKVEDSLKYGSHRSRCSEVLLARHN